MQRKSYSIEFKQQLIQEAQEVGNASQVARKHGIDGKMLSRWIRQSRQTNWKQANPESRKIASYTPFAEGIPNAGA